MTAVTLFLLQYLVVPQAVGLLVFVGARLLLRPLRADPLVARPIAILVPPLIAYSNVMSSFTTPIVESGGRVCGALGAALLFAAAPAFIVHIVLASFIHVVLWLSEDILSTAA